GPAATAGCGRWIHRPGTDDGRMRLRDLGNPETEPPVLEGPRADLDQPALRLAHGPGRTGHLPRAAPGLEPVLALAGAGCGGDRHHGDPARDARPPDGSRTARAARAGRGDAALLAAPGPGRGRAAAIRLQVQWDALGGAVRGVVRLRSE